MRSSRSTASPNVGISRRTSPPAAAGQHREYEFILGDAVRHAKARRVSAPGAGFEHRMPDMAGREPDLFEIGRLERQQCHDMIVPAGHMAGASRAPGPHHRGDIGDQRHSLAGAAQSMRHPPAKPGAVDRDDRVRPHRLDRRDGLAYPAQQSRGVRQYFGRARRRPVRIAARESRPLFPHLLAADPGDAQPRAGALAKRAGPGQRQAYRPRARRR